MANLKFYKIRHKELGLYSKGGSYVNDMTWGDPGRQKYHHWSKKGKVWQGMGPLKSHLRQYTGYNYGTTASGTIDWSNKTQVNNIPETWIVEEHDMGEGVVTELLAKDLIKV